MLSAPAPSPLPAPPSSRLADAARFLPTAANVAETGPTARGANRTVTEHDLPGPRLAPVQVSAVTVNAAAPAAEMVKAPEALPPLFTRVNARSGLPPIDTKPYAYCDRSNASTAGPAPADATPASNQTRPHFRHRERCSQPE